MKIQNAKNIFLFLLVAVLVIMNAKGGVPNLNETWIEILSNVGISMLGGVVCGVFLYGTIPARAEKKIRDGQFVKVDLNREMGQEYWINFIKNIDTDPSTLWFVGTRHLAWIDKGYAYRKHVIDGFERRVNKFGKKNHPLEK